MQKNNAIQEALKKAGISKDAFKQERPLKSNKKADNTSESWKAGSKPSNKLRKAQNQAPEAWKDGAKSSQKLRKAQNQTLEKNINTDKEKKPNKKRKKNKGKRKNIKMPTYLNSGHLESVYGGGKSARKSSNADKKKPENKISCRLPDPLTRSECFDNKYQKQSNLLHVSDSHLWQSQQRNTDSVNSIVIGLDFGTSSTKVVMQDVARHAYAVPFTDASENPYLLPAKIFESQGVFSLEPSNKVYRDLKLILIQDRVDQVALVPAVAYLALIIRHCQGWLWDNHRDIYSHDMIVWGLNLGLPAASYENIRLVERFLIMAIAALDLAGTDQQEMNKDTVFEAIKRARHEINETKQTTKDLAGAIKRKHPVSVYPEIAAQVFGFVRSTSWDSGDRPMMMMVDIGAGTVDASIFTVVKDGRRKRSFNFFGNNVRSNGVMNLHRARMKWLRDVINDSGQWSDEVEQYFCDIEMPTDRLMPIPEDVVDYIPGMKIENAGSNNIENKLYMRYSSQLYSDTILKVQNTKNSSPAQWRYLPFFLCGGGSNMGFYKRFADNINKSSSTSVSLDVLELPKPDGLEAKGLRSNEFHRLAVAFGLSFDDIGDFVKPDKIPDISRTHEKRTYRDNYVDKDQV